MALNYFLVNKSGNAVYVGKLGGEFSTSLVGRFL